MGANVTFANLEALAAHLRTELQKKKFVLLYAYNGTGKTRLSMAFKDIGKKSASRDTLYFNAFTEDLFTWDNDLEGDSARVLKMNAASRFFAGLESLEMENRIRPFLHRYADFDFSIDYSDWSIRFSRNVQVGDSTQTIDNIKVSRGEENLFIWCFFLAIVQLAMDGDEAYRWVKYIYIDDPISSLDEHNAITVGNHLAQFMRRKDHAIKTVISSHHTLFFNVLWNELWGIDRNKFSPHFLSCTRNAGEYQLAHTGDTPFFHHLALLQELWQAKESGQIYTHHFNALRSLLEKASIFHGYKKFTVCIKQQDDDTDGTLYGRIVNILSHGNYSFYDPVEMLPENKVHFEKLLTDFLNFFPFNSELTPKPEQESTP
ncbi:anticodon nuclease [Allofranklinella schreckenbergeri]|uniref:Anticodon nuclease n=1 Tax=Allofranklinella schreckenbergeri TaxID=1076744 RepID=A0A3M6R6R3_9BURK|nr:AAA family ATPase [Allofranklinella schreckenbergeri]RMX10418.1 anticodon nuclease [Allofranklinella schreckenbergeri]